MAGFAAIILLALGGGGAVIAFLYVSFTNPDFIVKAGDLADKPKINPGSGQSAPAVPPLTPTPATALGFAQAGDPVEPIPDQPLDKMPEAGHTGRSDPPLAVSAKKPRMEGNLTVERLAQIKNATVFILVQTPIAAGSGSGFVISVEGSTALVATNNHVVALPTPAGGNFKPVVTVAFNSGTAQEQAIVAEVLATDAEVDLAVLRVTNVKNPPEPIPFQTTPELIETMPVCVFGFPFGQMLSANHGLPAITVGRGSISSIRRDEEDHLAKVQIDGDLNPGNSGGPVVDLEGQLVGVAVSTIRTTRIGFAVPPGELSQMLLGHTGETEIRATKSTDNKMVLEARVELVDPLKKVQSASLHFVRVDSLKEKPKPNKFGNWSLLPGTQRVALKFVDSRQAVCAWHMPVSGTKEVQYAIQVSHVDSDGKTVFSRPRTVVLRPGQVGTLNPPGR